MEKIQIVKAEVRYIYYNIHNIYTYVRVSGRGVCRPPGPSPFLRGFGIIISGENGDIDVPSAKECAVVVGGWCAV